MAAGKDLCSAAPRVPLGSHLTLERSSGKKEDYGPWARMKWRFPRRVASLRRVPLGQRVPLGVRSPTLEWTMEFWYTHRDSFSLLPRTHW